MNKWFLSVLFSVFCWATLMAQHAEWRDHIENKRFERVIADVGDLQPADSIDFTKMYLIGQAYEGLLKYKDAYNWYKQCYLLDSTRIDMLNTLARMAVNLGKTKEAEKYYQTVLEYDSTNFFANYQLARLYVLLEDYWKGLYYYELLLENDPENTVILRAMGDCFTQLQFLEAALEYYQEAYRLDVENASLATTLTYTMLSLYNPIFNNYADDALAVCDTALFYNPGHKILRQRQAMIYYVKREYVTADSLYTSLMANQDSSYVTLKYCGCARYFAQKWFDAIEPLEKAFEMDTTAYDVCLFLGISLGRTYDPKTASQYLDKAEKLLEPNPYWSDLLIQFRAEMYLKTGNCNKGAELFYQLWMKDKKQIAWLQQIHNCYRREKLNDMSDEVQQRYLFVTYLYASEITENPKERDIPKEYKSYLLSTLKKFEEEMFFRGVTSLPMMSPDNKKTTLSLEKLKELAGKLSEN